MTRLPYLALVLVTLALPTFGADPIPPALEKPKEAGDASLKPVLSNLGKKRVRDNIAIVNGNIHDLQENLVATHKNLQVIKEELKDLEGLEAEHLALQKKYQAYLDYASKEIKKNQKSTEDLDKWEKSADKVQKSEDKGLKEKMETARLERADRARWKMDAEAKTARVNELLKSLLQNLGDIRSRRSPLQEQMTLWSQKEQQYQSSLTDLTQRKANLEDLLRQ